MMEYYIAAACGGVLLGGMATMKLVATGNVLGISGSFKGVVKRQGWRPAIFTLGLLAGGFIAKRTVPESFGVYEGASVLSLFLAGLFVGAGTYTANGCTSGHGITGMARMSTRSMTSTATFFATAVGIATLFNTASLITPHEYTPVDTETTAITSFALAAAFGIVLIARKYIPGIMTENISKLFVEFITGTGFALGLVYSGMSQPLNTAKFLDLRYEHWSPALSFVMVGALFVKVIVYHYHTIERKSAMLGGDMHLVCPRAPIDRKLVFGSVLFGLGWGASGICPGPGFLLLAQDNPRSGIAFVGGLFSMYVMLSLIDSIPAKNPDEVTPLIQEKEEEEASNSKFNVINALPDIIN